MMKKLMALLMALMLMLSIGLTAVAEDVVLATAYNGEVSVTLSEVKTEFDEMVQAYIAYYAQYGYETGDGSDQCLLRGRRCRPAAGLLRSR